MGTTSAPHEGATAHGPRISGWLTFAGIIGLVVGAFNVIDGIVALFKPDYFLVSGDEILIFNWTAWGWIWLVVGIIQIAVGAGVLAGHSWARVAGVVMAAIAAIGQLMFLTAYPVWSVIVIAMCVLLIYALTAPPTKSVAA
ncbi:hypothetical protein GCM10010191_17360 [Actinomadura vinacea]|uniref:DUF7144 domain-containing protein n=1 Tax=Actinomadura vinacea TaxID=115336 RepID=A0ABP5VQM4_9ACTN